ncbi:MAG: TrlF family AAA-like ATPase [Rubrivivax sp.]
MEEALVPGSRWWRFDFHNHTPASDDYDPSERSSVTPRAWLLAYMQAGVDAVAVTDHNTADWVEPLQHALDELDAERPEGWRPLALYPGAEITASGGIHILALFAPGTPRQALDGLLHGALTGWETAKPNHEQQCAQSVLDVVAAIHQKQGLAIAAHADCKRGLLCGAVQADGSYRPARNGRDLEPELAALDAIELQDPNGPAAAHFAKALEGLAVVAGSDAPHRLATAGTRCSWVKMSRPDLAGLKLALLEPQTAVRPAPAGSAAPPLGGASWIRSLRIEQLQLLQRAPLELRFSPAYNAVIGGRGSGKSTVIESLRLALGREQELYSLDNEGLTKSLRSFKSLYVDRKNGGMMKPNSRLLAQVECGPGEPLQYTWAMGARGEATLTVQRREGDAWVETGLGAEQAQAAFPVRIYSQKQVLAMAEQPQALLELIDSGLGPAKRAWQQDMTRAEQALLAARQRHRALRAEASKRPALELEHRQAARKALVFKHANFGPLLQSFQKATQQQRAMDDFFGLLERDIEALGEAMQAVANLHETEPIGFVADMPAELQVREAALALRNQLAARRDAMVRELQAMREQLDQARAAAAASDWKQQAQGHVAAYTAEMNKLKAEGIASAQEAAQAVAAVERLDKQLLAISKAEEELPAAESAQLAAELALLQTRERLTDLRREFVAAVIKGGDMVRIDLRSMAHGEGAAPGLKQEILRLGSAGEWDDVWKSPSPSDTDEQPSGFLFNATREDWATPVGERLSELKRDLENCEKEVLRHRVHGAFEKRLKQLKPEDFDRLATWFPDDAVSLEYRPARGEPHQTLKQASAGQRAAAMLSFLLAQGDEPLLLDQPEDDLDNALVSELVVQRIREGKLHRQLIVVTHNANVVVNGDAELVLHMGFRSGSIDALEDGGLQEPEIRQSVCDVMEGGRKAFEQRYRRILKDLDKVVERP